MTTEPAQPSSIKGSDDPPRYDPEGLHRKEGVYNTPLSSLLQLHQANRFVHSIPSLPLPLECVVFFFGYAFNPLSIPLWLVVVCCTGALPSDTTDIVPPDYPDDLLGLFQQLLFPPAFYLATVLTTLLGTEVLKAIFSASRPEAVLSASFRESRTRRFRSWVASLKSKHSFPSGDSAQAANLVLFLKYYVFIQYKPQTASTINWMLALGFYPGVAFARVFYHCHWIEDTLAGGLLALGLHKTVMPHVSVAVWWAVHLVLVHFLQESSSHAEL